MAAKLEEGAGAPANPGYIRGMARLAHPRRASITDRMCLACGYRGPELQPADTDGCVPGVFECPCCRADLYARPARSYAEMEGLPFPAPAPRDRGAVSRRIILFPRRGPAAAAPSEARAASRLWRVAECLAAMTLMIVVVAVATAGMR